MQNTKGAAKSLTIVVGIVGVAASLYGVEWTELDAANFEAQLDNIAAAVGFVVMVYGRFRAKSQIEGVL